MFSKNFTSDSSNQSNVQLLNGETRTAQGTYVSGTGTCESGACDYGVLWLTNYTGKTYASSPKMINIGNDQLLLMWEKKEYIDENEYIEEMEDESDYEDYASQYIESCYMVVSSNGTVIIPETTIQDLHLSEYGELSYKDSCIYWSTSDGKNNNIEVHRLAIGEKTAAKIKVASIKADKNTIKAIAGKKTQIKVTFSPLNTENKNLHYKYDKDLMTVDENGYITVKNVGSCKVKIISEENKDVFTYVTVNTTDKAPTNLKAVQVTSDYEEYRVKLSWKKTLYAECYDVYRSTSKDTGYQYIDSIDGLYYIDYIETSNKKYYYKVKTSNYVMDENNLNPYSDTATIYVVGHPQNVKVNKESKTSANITWSNVKSADGYEIYYYVKQDKKYVLLKTYNDNTKLNLTQTNLSTGQMYLFKVRAFKTINNIKYYSDFSETVKIKM